MGDVSPRPWEGQDEDEAPLAWGTWLRNRLEREPTWDDDEGHAVGGPTEGSVPSLPATSEDDVATELRSLRQAIEALPTARHSEILAELSSIHAELAALSAGPGPELSGQLASIGESVAALPVGPDPAVAAELEALREAVAGLPTGPDWSVVSDLQALREAVAGLPTGPDPAVLAELQVLREAVAGLPTGPDPALLAELQAVREAVAGLPTGPDPAVLAELQAVREAVAGLPTGPHAEVLDGLHSLRQVMEALVEVVVGIPSALQALDRKVDEHASALARALHERGAGVEHLERLDQALTELGHGVTERILQLSGWLQLLTKQQTRVQATSDATREAVAQLADADAVDPPVVELDPDQLRTLATAVAELLREPAPPPRPRRDRPMQATREASAGADRPG